MEVRNFINGNFVDSFSKQNIRVVNPADQTDVGFIDEALDAEIEFAIGPAMIGRSAFVSDGNRKSDNTPPISMVP